jgi:hypothetical protein
MHTRHRIPSIFNLSMVDVLCCALGCIILLWLVYFKEARERSAAAGRTGKELVLAKQQIASLGSELTNLQQVLVAAKTQQAHLSGQLAAVAQERDSSLAKWEKADRDARRTEADLRTTEERVSSLRQDLKKLEASQNATAAALAAMAKDKQKLTGQLADANQMRADQEKQLGTQKEKLAAVAKSEAELRVQLTDAEKNALKLGQQLLTLKAMSKEYADQVAKLESRATALERDLDKRRLEMVDAGKRQDDLRTTKNLLEQTLAATKTDLDKSRKELADAKQVNQTLTGSAEALSKQVIQLRVAAENRFAGIELAGSNVIFLIDMSGSMRMKNYTDEDPEKWPLLCEILRKLMRSLPDLKQFQVILFSEKFSYPMGNRGQWIQNTGPESIKKAIDAVRAEVPQGETNMSKPFEEVFSYRSKGLDTVFMLSDGLPNAGDGLPPGSERLNETDRGNLLGKYIRTQLKTNWNQPYGRWAKSRVRINAVGFYFDSPDVGAFLWALARDNGGSFVGLSKP